MSPDTFPIPSGDTENRAPRGGMSPGTPLLLAETPVGQQQPSCHLQAPGWWLRSQHKPCRATTRRPQKGLGEGTWGSWGWDPPQLPLTPAKALAARGTWHESPWMGAAPRDGLSPPPPGSLPSKPPWVGGCPQDQAVCDSWVTLAQAGGLRDTEGTVGRDSGAPSAHLLLDLQGWTRRGVARGGQAAGQARRGQGTHR